MQETDKFAVITIGADSAFRGELNRLLADIPFVSPGAEISAPPGTLDGAYWEELRFAGPGCVMIDLDADRADALRLIAQVAERTDLKVVAFSREVSADRVLEAIRGGASEFIPKPVDPGVLADALRRIRRQLEPRPEAPRRAMGRVLTFLSTKGGSGASTVACNAAVALAQTARKSVLLVDLEPQLGELALFLGLKPRHTLQELFANLHRADETLLQSYVLRHESGVHLLAGPDSPEPGEQLTGEQIRKGLQFLRGHYEFVLLDMPSNPVEYVLAMLDLADQMFLVCTADLPSLKNVQRSLEIFERLGFGKHRIHVVLNRFDKREQGVGRPAVERVVGKEVFWAIPNDYPTVIRAINSGIPLACSNHTEIARSFAALARRIDRGEPAKEPEPGSRRLRRFFK
jgi:pilus assembly protein CpaE